MIKRKTLLLGLPALVTIAARAGTASAQPGWGWRYGPRQYGYSSGPEVTREAVETAARAQLARVRKGDPWNSPRGIRYIPLILDTEIVGHLWEDADPASLHIGSFWAGSFGRKVELVSGNRVVGMMWLRG